MLIKSDLLFLTETQLNDTDNTSIEDQFNEHRIFFNNNPDKFKSLAVLFRENMTIETPLVLDGIFIATYFDTKHAIHFSVLLCYRKNNSNIEQFKDLISYLVRSKMPDLILGDFNLNIDTTISHPFVSWMSQIGYEQLISKPTHVSGSIIDHLYVSKSFYTQTHVSIVVRPLYFSDHNAVVLHFN